MSFTTGTQLDLGFDFEPETIEIPGLTYIPDYISSDEQSQLLETIDQQIWSAELKRRVQHYGSQYDYKKRAVSQETYLGALPIWAQNLASRFFQEGLIAQISDQIIVNEYQPGQGIASHIDCIPCFGDTILSLSLGSACVMNFTRDRGDPCFARPEKKVPILLNTGSLLILRGEARYEWQHGIAAKKRDNYRGTKFVRSRRISLTFRKVLISDLNSM